MSDVRDGGDGGNPGGGDLAAEGLNVGEALFSSTRLGPFLRTPSFLALRSSHTAAASAEQPLLPTTSCVFVRVCVIEA